MSNAGELSASEWLDQNMGPVVAFSIRAGAVAYQGARIDDALSQLRLGEPREIVLAQLHDELREEYAAMLTARYEVDYDDLQVHAATAHANLAERTREADALHLMVATEMHQVQDEVEQAAEHAPAAELQLMAYMQDQIARLIGTRGIEQAWRQHREAHTVDRYAGALAMMDYVPVPDHLTQEERESIEAQVRARVQPAEPAGESPLDIHALAAAVREANPGVEGQGFNTLAALVLLQDPSRRFTAVEIGSVLYPGDDPAKAANKAGALLHHSLEGRPGGAGRILAESGYRLVRGTTIVSGQDSEAPARLSVVYGIEKIES